MTWFDFTAAAATDKLTKVAHGLLTGDGPLTTLMRGGTEGGLASASDYWAIRDDADNIRLAATQADALAGVPVAVNVTADVKGILGIGLPFKRLRNYVAKSVDVAGSQVYSGDLNKFQDAIINLKHGPVPFIFPASSFTKIAGAGTLTVGQYVGICTLVCPLPFAAGTTIAAMTWGYNRGGAGAVTLTLAEANPSPPFSSNGAFAPTVNAGTGYTKSDYIGADIDTAGGHKTLPANSAWTLQIDQTNAANVFGGVIITAFRD